MKAAIIAIVIVVLAAVGVVVITKKDESKTNDQTTPSSSSSETGQEPVSSETENQEQSTASASSSVSIEDFSFKAAKITVKKGTKVTWTNKDSTRHTVTPDQATADFKASELLAQNESYSVTFNTVGTFTYHCEPHPQMKGTVEVTE